MECIQHNLHFWPKLGQWFESIYYYCTFLGFFCMCFCVIWLDIELSGDVMQCLLWGCCDHPKTMINNINIAFILLKQRRIEIMVMGHDSSNFLHGDSVV